MPVVRKAVLTSPQGIAVASFSPAPKSMRRLREPSGMRRSSPPSRTQLPWPRPSTPVAAVPRLSAPRLSKPSASRVASGSAAASVSARQSVGTTSNPVPGQTTMPAARAAASCPKACSKTSISPVMSV